MRVFTVRKHMCVWGYHGVSMSSALHLGLELRLLEISLRHPEPLTNTPACICVCEKSRTSWRGCWQRAKTGVHRSYPRLNRAVWWPCVCITDSGTGDATWPRHVCILAYKVQHTVHLHALAFQECALVLCLHPIVSVCTSFTALCVCVSVLAALSLANLNCATDRMR